MPLLGFLPLAALGLGAALLYRRGAKPGEAITLGTLFWAYGVALVSEALSLLQAIAFASLLAGWSLAVILLAAALLRSGRPAGTPRRAWSVRMRAAAAGLIAEEWILAAVLAIVGGTTLLLALVSPPNNWDSQVYHLPRIEHWIQNGSFAFYRTAIDRQIEMPDLAEVLLLQFRLLTGEDRLLNLLQWLAGAGCIFLVGRIALALGAARRGAALARLTAATLPVGILEASSTQNDLVATFFLLAMAERLLAWRWNRRARDAAAFALAAGLALATKGTAYLIGFPLGLWFLAAQLKAGPRALPLLIACGLLILTPNLPNYARNFGYSGSLLGHAGRDTNNAAYGLGDLAVNGARNLAVNLATQNSRYDAWLTQFTGRALAALGLDANAPALTFAGTRFALTAYQSNEDFAANPVQLILGVVSVVVVLLAGGGFPRRRYALCLPAATLLFLLVLRWQPWITRLQLPIFALSAPLAAFLLFERDERRAARLRSTAATALLAILLLSAAWPALWMNMRRPLFSPAGDAGSIWARTGDQILFAGRPELQLSYLSAAHYAARHGDSRIGLVLNGNDWEYPLWRLLRRAGTKNLRIEHVDLSEPIMAHPYPLGPFDPTVVFVIRTDPPPDMMIEGALWHRVQQYPALSIYRRSPP
jgi:hypothetical protein